MATQIIQFTKRHENCILTHNWNSLRPAGIGNTYSIIEVLHNIQMHTPHYLALNEEEKKTWQSYPAIICY